MKAPLLMAFRTHLLPVLFALLVCLPASAQEEEKGKSDSAVFKARSDSVWEYVNKDLDSALSLGKKNLRFAERSEDLHLIDIAHSDLASVLMSKGEFGRAVGHLKSSLELNRRDEYEKDTSSLASTYQNIGLIFFKQGKNDSALHYYRKSIDIRQKRGDPLGLGNVLNSVGNVFRVRSNYPKALSYYQDALDALDRADDENEKVRGQEALIQANIGSVHKERGSYDKAIEAFEKAGEIFEEKENLRNQGNILLSIGEVHKEKGELDTALARYRRSLPIFKKVGIPRRIAMTHDRIGSIQKMKGRTEKASSHLDTALSISRRIGALSIEASALSEVADLHLQRSELEKAYRKAKKGKELAERVGSLKLRKNFAEILYNVQKAKGRYREALPYLEEVRELEDSIMNEERAKKLTRMEMSYSFEKERMRDSLEHQKEIEVREAELERERTLRYGILGGSGVLLLLLGVIYDRFRVARKRKAVIEEQKEEVDRAYDELHEKNAELEDSINYASRIQSAILTSDAYFQEVLPEHFVLFRPKEMVSGDFYWCYGDDRYAIWLAADCTGHGVPGAFMSMIGNRLFNEIVVEQGERDPGTIFEKVRSGIIEALEQGDEEETNDGMDAALCVYDRKSGELSFAGAQNPLYIVQSAEEEAFEGDKVLEEGSYRLVEIKGNGTPIGRDPYKKEAFRTVSLQLRGGETLYTFSDGFADQFGGPKGKKYRYKPFKRLLLSVQDRSMEEQKKLLDEEFIEWKGDQEQIDDVVVIGVRPGQKG